MTLNRRPCPPRPGAAFPPAEPEIQEPATQRKPASTSPRTRAAGPLSRPDCQGRMVAARPAERGGPRIGDPVPVAIAPAGGGGDLGQFMLGHEARQYALRAAI